MRLLNLPGRPRHFQVACVALMAVVLLATFEFLTHAQGKERFVEHPTIYHTTQINGHSPVTLYMQNYGGLVGFRMDLVHPA